MALIDPFAAVVGQDGAVATLRKSARRPVHAYLLVGPPGVGKEEAARGLAALLLCPTCGDHPTDICDSCERALAGLHPDLVEVEREGPFLDMDTARELTRRAFVGPVESARKVVVIHDLHLVRDSGPALLKTLEEPPATTVFICLAEQLRPELDTLVSRCLSLEFAPLATPQIEAALVQEGVSPSLAAQVAKVAGGRLDRARLLAADTSFSRRLEAWRTLPSRLDGTGAVAARLAGELVALLDEATESLVRRQQTEVEQFEQRLARTVLAQGASKRAVSARSAGAGAIKELQERQRRVQRRLRTDELRAGLAVLAGAYSERLGSDDLAVARRAARALDLIHQAAKDLTFNPGELLGLQALLSRLGRL